MSRLKTSGLWAIVVAWLPALLTGAGCDGDPLPSTGLWTASSQRLEVACFAFFRGSMRFEATRAQLSTEQLALLSDLRIVDAEPTCVPDTMDCQISVTDPGGNRATMHAITTDPACAHPRKLISFESFRPFLLGLPCQFALDLTDPAYARPVAPDPRCFNGLYTQGLGAPISVLLTVGDPRPVRRIELDACGDPRLLDQLTFTLRDTDGVTPLASSAPPADFGPYGTCAALDTTFPGAGAFPLDVAIAAGSLTGDFFLRFY